MAETEPPRESLHYVFRIAHVERAPENEWWLNENFAEFDTKEPLVRLGFSQHFRRNAANGLRP